MPNPDASYVTVYGGCHCGDVRFEADLPLLIRAVECNCSICSQSAYQHVFVEKTQLRWLTGQSLLCEYRFNTRSACHWFCPRCGIKSVYVPRSHPDGYSLNLRCLELGEDFAIELAAFDGRNWSANIQQLHSNGQRDD